MSNSSSVSPWLVCPRALRQILTASYLNNIILFPKNLTCSDWTTQNRIQIDRHTFLDVHTCSLGLHLFPMLVCVQSLALFHGKGCGM